MAKGKRKKSRAKPKPDEGAVTEEEQTDAEVAPEEEAASTEATAEPAPESLAESGEEAGTEANEETDEKPSPESEVEQLRAQVAELTDKHLRAVADLDNYRKRARREVQESLRYATSNLMTDLLPVLDNFERALSSGQDDGSEAGLQEGVELILKQFSQTLERHGLSLIEAQDQPFDPTRHEALGQLETDGVEPGTIVQEVQKGYSLYDRVLRATQVFVAAEPPGPEPDGEDSEESASDESAEVAEAAAADTGPQTDEEPDADEQSQ